MRRKLHNFIDTFYFYILSLNLNKDFVLTTKVEKFLQFLNEIKSGEVSDHSTKLLSYSFSYPLINFGNVINNLYKGKYTFFYWDKPDEEYTIVGIDSIYDVNQYGAKRTEESRTKIEQWIKNFYNNFDKADSKSIPLFMGGMKFSPEGISENSIWNDYADSDWFIPKVILFKKNQQISLVHNFIYKNETEEELIEMLCQQENLVDELKIDSSIGIQESVEESNLFDESEKIKWTQQVNSALNQISSGLYKKIVLSRRVHLKLSSKPNLDDKLKNLANNYPRCYIFAYGKNESLFFGASPEKLAKISNGWVEADALAGSIPRGKSKSEDDLLANELLQSHKNLNEQNTVVDFITNSFSGFADEIIYDSKPIIRKLSNIQHLWTPIKAKLKPGNSIFSILKEIHPTPAICGVPWSGALDFIRATEGYNRGLYAGIIGWFNFEEQGEFAVSIRSALLKDKQLYAFAGCGIVEGSDPDLEFEETELKLKPILSLFSHEKVNQS